MVLDIDTENKKYGGKKINNKVFFSKLTTTLYLIILLPIVIALIGFLYLDQYKNTLISQELSGLRRQADTLAVMINKLEKDSASVIRRSLSMDSAMLLNPLAGRDSEVRIRLFQPDGTLLADTSGLSQFAPRVEVFRLPKFEKGLLFLEWIQDIKKQILDVFAFEKAYPLYIEKVNISAIEFEEVLNALNGINATMIRKNNNGDLILSVAVPVEDTRRVRGALMLSVQGNRIQDDIYQLQFSFFKIFIYVFLLTIILGYIFSKRITFPISKLARSADLIRASRNQNVSGATFFSSRNDEIGDLSRSLDKMTKDLWKRMDAIAAFAADVSHELKNPLTSLRSAVETLPKVKNTSQKNRLIEVILEDVVRLDRLISDISAASKLDSDLSKDELQKININKLISGLVDIRKTSLKGIKILLNLDQQVYIMGNEDRLVQVLDNLIANAISFSPQKGTITFTSLTQNGKVHISIMDQGPGIPESKLNTIFERFYSERPQGEEFGTHTGLGLSIVKQIINAHDGSVYAENVYGKNNNILGSKFTFILTIVS